VDTDEMRSIAQEVSELKTVLDEFARKVGRQKLFITSNFWRAFNMNRFTINTPVNVLYWGTLMGAENYWTLDTRLEPLRMAKRLPRFYLKLHVFGSLLSPFKNGTTGLFFAIPRETPPIPINYLPVFRDGKVVFVRKDKISQLQLQA
jgi:hypothetical protein